jgi:hypothetical protein
VPLLAHDLSRQLGNSGGVGLAMQLRTDLPPCITRKDVWVMRVLFLGDVAVRALLSVLFAVSYAYAALRRR